MAINIVNRFGTNCTTPKKNRSVEWIAVHYTAGVTSKTGSAVGLSSWYKNPAAVASSDFIVDDTTIVQYNEDIKNRYTWGVGGNMYTKTTSLAGQYYGICKNSNCINIEVCSNKTNRKTLNASDRDWYFTDSEIDLTVELVKYLMEKFNIDADHVVMHHQVTGKPCPAMWTHDESELKHWYAFKARLTGESAIAPEPPKPQATKYDVVVPIKGYSNAADAVAGKNPVSDIPVGSYYIYKEALGSYNISKTQGTPGSWIDPDDNKKEAETPASTPKPVVTEPDRTPVEYKNIVLRVDAAASAKKTVKDSKHFTYGEFSDWTSKTIVINKELVRGLEMLYDYLNLSELVIVKGNIAATKNGLPQCQANNKHKNGFAVDIGCYDAKGDKIPSDIVCCAAQQLGFDGIGKIDEYITHLDIRKPNDMFYFDATASNIVDFFKYTKVTQADIAKYTGEPEVVDDPTKILGKSVLTADELASFVKTYNPYFSYEIAEAFISIGEIYGIRGDVALCQSCVETGYFKYEGSAVTPDQHNYCGLGVTSNGMKGCEFETVEDGVEAQIQHLYAYATDKEIPSGRKLHDPRFTYVQRGCATTWDGLNHRWCTSNIYGKLIVKIYNTAKKLYR